MAERFVENVGKATGGAVRIENYPSGQLGFERELLRLVMDGAIDFALVQTSLSTVVGSFKLFELPYLVQDRRNMAQLFDEIVRPGLAPLAREQRLEVLAVIDGGFRQLNSKTPIKSPGDFKGLRIRTVGSAQVASLFEFLGAQPVLLSFAEVLPAARAGVINAADLPLSSILAARTFETFPFVTLTDHLYVPVYLVANAGTIQKLDERSTRALFEAARDTMMTSFKQGEETDRRDRERLGDRVKFIEMNPSEKRLLVEISRKSYDSLASELKGSSDLISRALRLGPRS